MSLLLYLSHNSKLTEKERLFVDQQTCKNREKIRVSLVSLGVITCFSFGKIESCEGMDLNMPSLKPIMRVRSDYEEKYEIKAIPFISSKPNKISFFRPEELELPICIYAMDQRFLKMSQSTEFVNRIRGGNLVVRAASLLVFIIMWKYLAPGLCFAPNPNPEFGNRVDPFQPQGVNLQYPPICKFLFPRSQGSQSTLKINKPAQTQS
jgi:hypothetical protein